MPPPPDDDAVLVSICIPSLKVIALPEMMAVRPTPPRRQATLPRCRRRPRVGRHRDPNRQHCGYPLGGGIGVVELCRRRRFGRQPVLDGNNGGARGRCQRAGQRLERVVGAHDQAAAVQVDQHRLPRIACGTVDPNRNRRRDSHVGDVRHSRHVVGQRCKLIAVRTAARPRCRIGGTSPKEAIRAAASGSRAGVIASASADVARQGCPLVVSLPPRRTAGSPDKNFPRRPARTTSRRPSPDPWRRP